MTALVHALVTGAHPDHPLGFPDRSTTHGELLGAARALAQRIGDQHRVCLRARPTLDTVTATVACLLAGVSIVPVPDDAGEREIAHIVRDCGAGAWLGEVPAGVGLTGITIDVGPGSDGPTLSEPAPETEALILYTSGTTGPPKGVPHTRAALAADLDALADAWAWTADDVLVHGLPLYHVHGLVLGVLGPLRIGSALRHTGRPSPQAYAAAAGSLYFGVPTVWHRLADDPGSARELASARLLVSGSAALPAPVFERIEDLTGHRLVERYGMTESLITVSARFDGPRRPGYVGWPLAEVSTRVCDDDGRVLPHDGQAVGSLQVRGPMVFGGYLGRPEETARSFTDDGWFVTGDVATIGPDGNHRIVGRASTDLIKTGGFRVGAGEIEAELLAHPAVREAAVVGEPDPDLGQRIIAYVVADEPVAEQGLIEWVGERLSAHKRPRAVRFVAVLPRNALGKVVKGDLGGAG